MAKAAICVQAFNKADTIIETLESLARARLAEEFDLIVVQDGLEGNRFKDRYSKEHSETKAAIEAWLVKNGGRFKTECFICESIGRGTAGTAKVAIDYGFENHDWVVFSEDDLIYELDALEWFSAMIDHEGFLREDVWGIAGEAKHFDSKGLLVAEETVREAKQHVRDHNLISKFFYFGWMPSSCFATNKKKWGDFGDTRGLPRGPKQVNDRCKAEGKKSLWPVVARARDIGMHHSIGYSMGNLPLFNGVHP